MLFRSEPLAGFGVMQGDFVIRLILNRNVVTMPDMGMGMDSGMDSGMDVGADIGMDSGIVVVDMAPDGTILDMRDGTEEDLGGNSGEDSGGGVDLGGVEDSGNGGGGDDGGGNTGGGDELELEAVSPSSAASDASTDVLILGEGFELGLEVSLNARKIGVIEVASERITANVPSGLEEGLYDVIVTNPDGESAILVGAFTVTGEGGEGSGDTDGGGGANGGNGNGVDAGCGCRSTAASAQDSPVSLLALALAGFVALRRWRARA